MEFWFDRLVGANKAIVRCAFRLEVPVPLLQLANDRSSTIVMVEVLGVIKPFLRPLLSLERLIVTFGRSVSCMFTLGTRSFQAEP